MFFYAKNFLVRSTVQRANTAEKRTLAKRDKGYIFLNVPMCGGLYEVKGWKTYLNVNASLAPPRDTVMFLSVIRDVISLTDVTVG